MPNLLDQLFAQKHQKQMQEKFYQLEAYRAILSDPNQPAENKEWAFGKLVPFYPKEYHQPGGPLHQAHQELLGQKNPPINVPNLSPSSLLFPEEIEKLGKPSSLVQQAVPSAPSFSPSGEPGPPQEPQLVPGMIGAAMVPPPMAVASAPVPQAVPLTPPEGYTPRGPAGMPARFPGLEEITRMVVGRETAMQGVRTKGALDIFEGQKDIARKLALEDMAEIEKTDWWTGLTAQQKAQARVAVMRGISLPSFAGIAPRAVGGVMKGSDVPENLAQDMGGNPIDHARLYKAYVDLTTGTITGVVPTSTERSTVARPMGGMITGAEVPPNFTVDMAGNTVDPSKFYRAYGDFTKTPPVIVGVMPTVAGSERDAIAITTDAYGRTVVVPYTSTTRPATGPIPSRPSSATPIPPPPGEQSVAPVTPSTGVRLGQPRIIGEKPVTSEEKKLQENAASGLKAIRQMRAILKGDKNTLVRAAIPGSPGARVFSSARKEAIDVLTRLRTGAALNQEEEEFYKSQFPNIGDLVLDPDAINYKLNMYEDLFDRFTTRGPARRTPIAGGITVQRNTVTGENRYSTDGGKTWHKGLPPSK